MFHFIWENNYGSMVFVLESISKLAWDWWAGSAQFDGYCSLPNEDSMAYTDLLFDICQQFSIHYYTATKKSTGKKTMPTALWHTCSEHAKKSHLLDSISYCLTSGVRFTHDACFIKVLRNYHQDVFPAKRTQSSAYSRHLQWGCCCIDFMTGDVIEGQLPPKALAMVRE